MGQVLEAGGVVCHWVEHAGKVVVELEVPMVALVACLKSEEFGGTTGRGGRAFALPGKGRSVVGPAQSSAFVDVETVCGACQVEEGASQFQVGVSDVAVGVAATDEALAYVVREGHSPHDGGSGVEVPFGRGVPHRCRTWDGSGGGEPDTTSTRAGGVMVANKSWL